MPRPPRLFWRCALLNRTSLNCAILVFGTVAAACAADRQISFAKDIQPVFQKTCWNCHSASVQLSKLSLATRDDALKGGDHGPAIVPGDADKSRLFRLVAGVEKPAMPIGGKLRPMRLNR